MKFHSSLVSLAVLSVCAQVGAQEKAAPAKLERVEVTGSMIKRINKETPSVVQTITRDDIRNSGFATVEELLRSTGAVDSGGSVADGAATGFVAGVATLSLRGFGSQGTLVLINGRRIAPVAAVDINFGRGSLLNVNSIPRGAIERVEVLKDGASAIYGSDAMAGVVNYVLRKEYVGAEANVSVGANEKGQGWNKTAGLSFGFGNLDTQRFNVYGGMELSRRDPVMFSELKDRGSLSAYNQYLVALAARGTSVRAPGTSSFERFTPSSPIAFPGNYYQLPASFASTVLTPEGYKMEGNSSSGNLFLGNLGPCPDAQRVGAGVPARPPGLAPDAPSLPAGMCRFSLDDYATAISQQERVSGNVRATYALTPDLMAYADVMLSRTQTLQGSAPSALTGSLVTSANRAAVSWPKLDGTLNRTDALILPVGHPDNRTNGFPNAQPVQLLYRFMDLPQNDVSTLKSMRFLTGIEGHVGDWDIDAALLYSRQDNERINTNRLRKSLLENALKTHSYRFTQTNDAAALASVASDASNVGRATIVAVDVRASRELLALAGGAAAVAMGVELRRETLSAQPDEAYLSSDYIGLVGSSADGSRRSVAAFSELSLPVHKKLELQAALRAERYSDFGNATTGKLGFKWTALPSVALRGTAATGFRAPAISQIGKSFVGAFNSFQEYRVVDKLRCDESNPSSPVSLASPSVSRDCNVLGLSSVSPNPGSLATAVSANPHLKPETSRSFTLGLLLSPSANIDLNLDAWFFQRNDEIRVQRGVDVIAAANQNPGVANPNVIRDSNEQTWLPSVPNTINSGPILMLVRQYGNYNWTKTSGLDYDLAIRFPAQPFGQFRLNVSGTYTNRYDVQVLSGTPTLDQLGNTTNDIPRSKATATLKWSKNVWSSWLRYNHVDALSRGATTATCLSGNNAANVYLRDNRWCDVRAERNFDWGGSYAGFKNWTLAASVMNLANTYQRAITAPAAFTHYDGGSSAMLGRRFNLTANYVFK